jgi:hypothetical protein
MSIVNQWRIRDGSFDVNDLGTIASPISIPGTGAFTKLTNDGLGPQTTNAHAPRGITELWDVDNNQWDFSQLNMGDVVDIRLDIAITTVSPNTQLLLRMEAGLGVFAFPIGWDSKFYGSADPYPLVRSSFVAMQTTPMLTGKAEFQLAADKDCTVVVKGWHYIVRRIGK